MFDITLKIYKTPNIHVVVFVKFFISLCFYNLHKDITNIILTNYFIIPLFNEGINTINDRSVPEDSGFCMYTFIDDHLNRVYGGSLYLYNGGKTPDVNVINNKLVCEKRPKYLKDIAWFLNNSETMKYFNITNSYPKTIKFYKRFAGLINYIADKYWNVKPHNEFYVGLYPHNATDTTWLRFLDEKIKVLKIPSPQDYDTNPSYMNKKFWHPKKGLNLYYEKEISKLIFKNK